MKYRLLINGVPLGYTERDGKKVEYEFDSEQDALAEAKRCYPDQHRVRGVLDLKVEQI
jgi:hypothetical protein